MRLLVIALLATALLAISGCSDGCPVGKHSHVMTVNNVTTVLCIDD